MNVAALVYAGVVGTAAVTFIFAAAFFVQAWRHRPRDGEYFIFGLLALCLAAYAAAACGAYVELGFGEPRRIAAWADVGAAGVSAALALVVHFTLRYVRSSHERAVMRVVYPLMGVFAVGVLCDGLWVGEMRVENVAVFGTELPVIRASTSWLGNAFLACQAVAYPSVIVLLYRSYRRGRRESGAALFGALCLLAAATSDVLGPAMGLIASPPLVPLGFLAFAYMMSLTLVARYGTQSAALASRQADLERRSGELARALAELEQVQADLVHAEQLAVVGEFAGVITHEIRDPMRIVTGAVNSLRSVHGVTDHTRSLLGIIEEEMMRLERLVSHLLDYARPVVPETRIVDLEALLENSLLALEAVPEVAGSLECVGPWPAPEGDAELLRHVVDNLVQNAVQAMDGRGELRIRVASRRVEGVACAVIGFEDTGEGMTEQQIEQARAPFYTSRPTGTGLGLSICDRIVEAHGGRLVIASEPGAGTAVSLLLPLKADTRLASD